MLLLLQSTTETVLSGYTLDDDSSNRRELSTCVCGEHSPRIGYRFHKYDNLLGPKDYGRVIHFLVRASQVFDRPDYKQLARRIADEAISHLYIENEGIFRSHPGEDRCDAVDGPGILLLALLLLDSGQERASAFAF